MPTARGDADVVLMNTDGTSNIIPIKLNVDSEKVSGGYKSVLRPFVPPSQPQGQSSYAQVDPRSGVIRPQTSWHRGFGQHLDLNAGQDFRYGYSDGVLATSEGELVLGYEEDRVDIIVRNGRFESGGVAEWTGTNTVPAISTTANRSGTYGLQVTVSSNGGTLSQAYGGTDTVFRGQDLTLGFYARRTSGSGSITARITDDGASETDSSASSTTFFSLVEVTHTVHASASAITFTLLFSTASDVWEIDDIFVIPEGGISFTGTPVAFANEYYVPCGRTICKWDEDEAAFYPVYHDADNFITDLVMFSTDGTPRMYAGRGTADNYLTSTDGATWSDPTTNSGNSRLAEFFTVARNAIGNYALVKNRTTKISLTTNPTDTANWGAEIQVGQDSSNITSLFAADDTALVGKEDGLYPYDRDMNQFVDIEPEAGLFPDVDNFKSVLSRGKEIFVSGSRRIFWRIPFRTNERWNDLSGLIATSSFLGFGGRMTAITQDSGNIWIASPDDLGIDSPGFPYTFPFNFDGLDGAVLVRLISLKTSLDDQSGELVPHTISGFSATNVTRLGTFQDSPNNRSSLFAFGYTLNTELAVVTGREDFEPAVFRTALPLSNENPALVTSRRIRRAGKFFDSWWDGGFPDAEKAMVKLSINSRNLSSDKTVTVYYKTDNASDNDSQGWTLFGSTGVVNTSPVQTITPSLTSPITFRKIRFRYDFATDSSSEAPPRVESIVPHAILTSALDYLEWEIEGSFVDSRAGQRGFRQVESSQVLATTLSDINTLRQKPFVLFEDVDGTQYRVHIRERELGLKTSRQRDGDPIRSWDIGLRLTEVKTS